ncbi:hypothetical protein BDF22DRAFT_113612 [Syncephalis plumigaleata]|nr:hypothetical protein BDF22DRAFT_113612 [Syncephalis plumigaleata]
MRFLPSNLVQNGRGSAWWRVLSRSLPAVDTTSRLATYRTTLYRVSPLSIKDYSYQKLVANSNAQYSSLACQLKTRFNNISKQRMQPRIHSTQRVKQYSNKATSNGSKQVDKEPKPGSIRYLLKKYGRTGILVYAAVSTADYILCVLGVYLAGADHVLQLEYWIHSKMSKYFPNYVKSSEKNENPEESTAVDAEQVEKELEEKAKRDPTWTSLLLVAYGLHEILTPVRIAAAVALTPPIARRYRNIRWLVGSQAK